MPPDLAVRSIARALVGHRPAYWTMWRVMEASVIRPEWLVPPLLDLGVGDGAFASQVYPAATGIGIDRDRRDVRAAAARGHHRLVLQADAVSLPLAARSFQTIFSNCVLEHVQDIDTALGELARVLRPGGRLVCTVPHPTWAQLTRVARWCRAIGWPAGARAYDRMWNTRLVHHNLLSADGWGARFAEAGLRLELVQPFASPDALRTFEVLMWLAVPGHFVHAATGWRPFLRGARWADWLAKAAGPVEEGAGLLLVAERAP